MSREEVKVLCARQQCQNEATVILCDECRKAVDKALRELPELYTRLHQELEPSMGSGSLRVSGSREAPVPLRLGHSSRKTDMAGLLEDWEDVLREHEGLTGRPARGREGARLQGSALFLRAHLDQLIRHPEGVAACEEIRRLRGQVLYVLGRTKLVHQLPAPCPKCNQLGLVRDNGQDLVICGVCEAVWDARQYGVLTRTLAWEINETAKAKEATS